MANFTIYLLLKTKMWNPKFVKRLWYKSAPYAVTQPKWWPDEEDKIAQMDKKVYNDAWGLRGTSLNNIYVSYHDFDQNIEK